MQRSARAQGDGAEPILKRAVRGAAAKNCPGTSPLSEFVVLSLVSNSHLLSVISDSGLSLAGLGSPSELLTVLRAKELAQTTLAMAAAASASSARVAEEEAPSAHAHPPSSCLCPPSPYKRKHAVASATPPSVPSTKPFLRATPARLARMKSTQSK